MYLHYCTPIPRNDVIAELVEPEVRLTALFSSNCLVH